MGIGCGHPELWYTQVMAITSWEPLFGGQASRAGARSCEDCPPGRRSARRSGFSP